MQEKVSVRSCVNACGSSLSHLFIYKSVSGKTLKYFTDEAEESTMCAGQKYEWVSKDMYLKWFQEQFLKFALTERPVLLLFDGLKAHVSIELIKTAEESKLLLYCVPTHSSHLLEPVHLSVSGLLKAG